MSNVNIRRAVENIRASTTVYTPIVEIVVNAIQAIESKGASDGEIVIRVHRDAQLPIDGESLADVHSFDVSDNGIGFTDEHRNSFDTLYSDLKIEQGGKGFGRFTCLKYFGSLDVESVYLDDGQYKKRTFSMGKDAEIIVNEKMSNATETHTGTTVFLRMLRKGKSIEKKLSTIGRNLVEKLLPYFITKDYICPRITLSEEDGSDSILLNDYVSNELSAAIKEMPTRESTFDIAGIDSVENFFVRVFKLYYPRSQKSRISLVAHKREVSGSAIHRYIPEFAEDFYDKDEAGKENHERNYIVKAYVFGSYLDKNVSLERGGFEFQMENEMLLGISQSQIECEASKVAREAIGSDYLMRAEKKKARVQAYVDEVAPWHKAMLAEVDLTVVPYNPSDEEIETHLQKEKFDREVRIKRDVNRLLEGGSLTDLQNNVLQIVGKISGTSKNDLIHYIALRRNILELFGKSLELDAQGHYSSEGIVHDIIFPRKGNSDITSFEDHNLWIIDERLNFTNFVSSDEPLDGKNSDRLDLLAYNKLILFRGDNELGNPVTIFEFKKPMRDDFVDPSSKEDPVQQIVRYVNKIRDGKYRTPQGRSILIGQNTPFYGYVVCDLSPKVHAWLEREKNFRPMPDRMGWFQWYENINLYVEVISWEKILKDAVMRNRIFFKKLGI